MSKIMKAAEEILEKISFGDYKKPTPAVEQKKQSPSGRSPSGQDPLTESRRNIKKNKLTLYLTEEEEKLFNDIYINRLKKNKKSDRSTLFAEAVALLFAKEFQNK